MEQLVTCSFTPQRGGLCYALGAVGSLPERCECEQLAGYTCSLPERRPPRVGASAKKHPWDVQSRIGRRRQPNWLRWRAWAGFIIDTSGAKPSEYCTIDFVRGTTSHLTTEVEQYREKLFGKLNFQAYCTPRCLKKKSIMLTSGSGASPTPGAIATVSIPTSLARSCKHPTCAGWWFMCP